ncbi:MAG: redoxin domain-containing protein [Pseudomonadales bacterium]
MSGRKTGEPVPDFNIRLLNGGSWSSRAPAADKFTLLTIYRGMWCPHCKQQLQELDGLVDDFKQRGVSIVAASADTEDRAGQMAADYGLKNLVLGCEVPIDSARAMGVFISKRVKDIEMPLFCEPASLLIDKNANLFAAWIASCAFARTPPAGILTYVDFLADHSDRPPRGSA